MARRGSGMGGKMDIDSHIRCHNCGTSHKQINIIGLRCHDKACRKNPHHHYECIWLSRCEEDEWKKGILLYQVTHERKKRIKELIARLRARLGARKETHQDAHQRA